MVGGGLIPKQKILFFASNVMTLICYFPPRDHKTSATQSSPELIWKYTLWVILFKFTFLSFHGGQSHVLGTPCSQGTEGNVKSVLPGLLMHPRAPQLVALLRHSSHTWNSRVHALSSGQRILFGQVFSSSSAIPNTMLDT